VKSALRTITIDIPVPLAQFRALCQHKEKTGSRQEIHEMAEEAVREWLAAQAQRASAAHQSAAMKGYQWKDVFLPDGTVLRTVLEGRNVHATVEGDTVIFNGRTVSPSRFVNSAGKTVRNAWTAIWLLFPHQSIWKLANDCRAHRPGRIRTA
jgi:hypothetical protein